MAAEFHLPKIEVLVPEVVYMYVFSGLNRSGGEADHIAITDYLFPFANVANGNFVPGRNDNTRKAREITGGYALSRRKSRARNGDIVVRV
jgi:hypothetical protein